LLIAACRCDPWRCPDIPLTPADLEVWSLNWPKLGRALCHALGLDTKPAELGLDHTRQIGSWSADAVPVLLTLPTETNQLRSVIAQLAARLRQPFILLVPTNRLVEANCTELLAHAGAGIFDLASQVRLTAQGTLQATRPPGETFARFTPQPKEIDQDVAQRAFALVQALDSQRALKDPTVVTVFSHYCLEGLTVSRIAQKLGCSRGTVLNRLALIRRRTGIDPDRFRQLSPHLAKMEDSFTDPRAARLHRRRLIYDTPNSDQAEE
jgi:hypothetical protein